MGKDELNYVGQKLVGYLIHRHERHQAVPRQRFAEPYVPDLAKVLEHDPPGTIEDVTECSGCAEKRSKIRHESIEIAVHPLFYAGAFPVIQLIYTLTDYYPARRGDILLP